MCVTVFKVYFGFLLFLNATHAWFPMSPRIFARVNNWLPNLKESYVKGSTGVLRSIATSTIFAGMLLNADAAIAAQQELKTYTNDRYHTKLSYPSDFEVRIFQYITMRTCG